MSDYWSIEIRRIVWVGIGGVAIGLLSGYWLPSLLAVLLVYIIWILFKLHQLQRWLVREPTPEDMPDSDGVWEMITYRIYKFQQKSKFREKKYIDILRLHKLIGSEIGKQSERSFILHLSETFPLNIDRLLLFFPERSTIEEAIFQLKDIPEARFLITLIIGSDSTYQHRLFNTIQNISNKWVVPQGSDITRLLLSQNPGYVLAEILAGQLPRQQISPYRIGGGVNKESVFFGRRELIAQIINRDPANYLLVGGRQMGKSTLLKALQRRYADNPHVACHYLSLSNEILIPRIAAALELPTTKDPETLAEGLEALQRQRGQRFVFLIDEADDFIQHERASNYPILRVFRRLSEQGGCTFILAGFWQLYQHAVLDYQSPIRNFGEVLEVGALEPEACRQLATVPMATMNIHYANTAIVETLLTDCGQRANLIAIACQYLVQNLPLQSRVIEAGDVHNALHSREMEGRFSGWVIGNTEREQQYDRLVVYATIGQDSFSTGELIQRAQELGLHVDTGELDRTLARLELAFIIGRKEGRWFYRVPLFVKAIRTDAPELKLAAELHRLTKYSDQVG